MEFDEKLAYLTGFIIGDGNLGQGYIIRAVDENEEFISTVYSTIFENVFQARPKMYFDKYNKSFVAYIHSKKIWNTLVETGVQSGTKSRTANVPHCAYKNVKSKMAFISGIFDAEGSIFIMKDKAHRNGYPRLQMKMCNRPITEFITENLKQIGMNPRLYHYPDFSVIQMYGKTQCNLFHNNVGFKHPIKNAKLRMLL